MTNVCPSCTQGFRLPGEPSGQYIDLGGQPAYFAAGSGEENSKAILMFPDAFGLDMPNTQLIGDILSKEIGVDVFVLDMFHGQSEVMNRRKATDRPYRRAPTIQVGRYCGPHAGCRRSDDLERYIQLHFDGRPSDSASVWRKALSSER